MTASTSRAASATRRLRLALLASTTVAVIGLAASASTTGAQTVQYWHGCAPSFGGNGFWDSTTSNWRDSNDHNPGPWLGGEGVFQGDPGTITVQGPQAFQRLDFLVDGYQIVPDGGDATASLVTSGSGTLQVDPSFTATIAAPITGTGGITKIGTGTMIFSGANTYSGVTAVNAGTLQAGASPAFSANSQHQVGSAGTLDLNGFDQTIGSLADGLGGGGTVTTSSGLATLTTGGDNSTTSFSGFLIDGEGSPLSLVKTGSGIFTLSGSGNNTYSGTTTISQGTLAGGAMNAFSPNSDVYLAGLATLSATTLDLGGFYQTIAGLNDGVPGSAGSFGKASSGGAGSSASLGAGSGSETVLLGSNTLTIATKNSEANAYTGSITGSGGVIVSGSGEQEFGVVSYTGPTRVTDSAEIEALSANVFATSSSLTIGSSANFDMGGFDQTLNALNGDPGATVTNNVFQPCECDVNQYPATLTVGANNASSTFAGSITDGTATNTFSTVVDVVSLTKTGTGTFTLSGTNTYSGQTLVSGGTLEVDGSINPANPTDPTANPILTVASGGTLTGAGNIFVPVTVQSGGILAGATGRTLTVNSLVLNSGSNVNVALGSSDSSTLFSVSNDLTFGTTPAGVTLNVTAQSGFASGVYDIFEYGGLLPNPGGLAVGSIPGGRAASIDTSNPGLVDLVVGSPTLQFWHPSVEGGFGGSGTWNSNNTNWTDSAGQNRDNWGSVEGIFQGTPGTLQVQGSQAFQTLEFVTSGYQIVEGDFEGINELRTNGTGTLWAEGQNTTATISAPITGSGNITKIGAGTIFLTGNNSYQGGTFINAGTLAIFQDRNLGAASGGVTFNGGTLQFGDIVSLNASRTVTLGAAGGTFDTPSISFGDKGSSGVTVGSGSAILGNIVDGSGAQGSLTKTGPLSLTLSGNNSYSGATNVIGGTLIAGSSTAFGNTNAANVSTGATLSLNNFSVTIGGLGDGAGGGGTVNLGTGTLTLGNFDLGGSFSGVIQGTGGLTKIGKGNQFLNGASTYTGATVVSAGTLTVNGSLVSPVTIDSGATLAGTGSVGSTSVLSGATLGPAGGASAGSLSTLPGALASGSFGSFTVNGNLSFVPGSTYAVEVNAQGQNDFTHVTGKTTISGGTVGVLAANGTYQPSTVYKILTSDNGVNGTFGGTTSNFAFLTPTLTYDANDVFLTLQRNDLNFQQAAQPGNPNIVATALQQAVLKFDQSLLQGNGSSVALALANSGMLSSAGLTIIDRIDNLTAAGANLAFNSLSGEGANAAPEASFLASRLFSSAMLSQSAFWRNGGGSDANGISSSQLSSSDALGYAPIDDQHIAPFDKMGGKQVAFLQTPLPRTWRLWFTSLGGYEQLPGELALGVAKSSTHAYGGAGGIDYQINSNFLVGFAAGGTDGSFSTSARSTQGTAGGMHIGVYGTANFGHLYATTTLDGGYFTDHLKRSILGVGPMELANASPTENELGGRLEIGWKQGFDNFKVTPFAALEARRIGMPAFTEATAVLDGTPGILGLGYRSQSERSMRSYLGANIETPVDLGNGMELTPNLRLAWIHEFDRTRRIGAYLINLPQADFTITGARPARESLEANIGAQLGVTQNVKLFANFEGDFSHGGRSYAAMAGLKVIFDDLPRKAEPGMAGSAPVFTSREAAKVEEDALFPRLVREPQNLDLSFHFAEVASAAGDYEAAVGALERMRFYNTDLPRVELELGVLYFRLGSYKMALSHFEAAVSSPDTPDAVRQRVAEFEREIQKRLSPNQFTAFAQAGLRYQTNANAGPANVLVKALGQDAVLDSQFTRKADWNAFGLASARYFYDFGNQRGDGWQTDLTAYYARQFKVTRLDLGIAELQTGPRLAVAPDALPGLTFHPYVIGNAATLGDNPYLATLGAGAAFDYALGGEFAVQPSIEFRRREYRNSTDYQNAKDQTGNLVNVALAATGAISTSVRWQGRLLYATASANQTFDEYRQFGVDFGLPVDLNAPFLSDPRVWTVTPMAGYSLVRYGGPNFLVDPNVTRQDGEWHAGLSFDAPLGTYAGFAAQIMFQRVNSTLRNYDTRNFSVSAGPTVRF